MKVRTNEEKALPNKEKALPNETKKLERSKLNGREGKLCLLSRTEAGIEESNLTIWLDWNGIEIG